MKTGLKVLGPILSLCLLSSTAALAGLKDGTYTGKSTIVKRSLVNPDVMALLLKTDPNTKKQYAILAQYDRKAYLNIVSGPLISLTPAGKSASLLTSWVPRMALYEVQQRTDLNYYLVPMKVDARGDLVANEDVQPDFLTLKTANTIKDSEIRRFDRKAKDGKVVESVKMDEKYDANSTWEKMVVGNYLASTDNTGGDYLKKSKGVNATLDANGQLAINFNGISGLFSLEEKADRIFVVKSSDAKNVNADKIENKVAVFIDIVNWKDLGIKAFTTEEMLFIDLDEESNVGFFYERH